MSYEGTRIGADGLRYAMTDVDIPTDPSLYRRSALAVAGTPTANQVPMWNATTHRIEWGIGGATGAAGSDADATAEEARALAAEAALTTSIGLKLTGAKGTGTPEAAVTAGVGSIFLRTNGGAGTTLYIKESGAGNTGWVAK